MPACCLLHARVVYAACYLASCVGSTRTRVCASDATAVPHTACAQQTLRAPARPRAMRRAPRTCASLEGCRAAWLPCPCILPHHRCRGRRCAVNATGGTGLCQAVSSLRHATCLGLVATRRCNATRNAQHATCKASMQHAACHAAPATARPRSAGAYLPLPAVAQSAGTNCCRKCPNCAVSTTTNWICRQVDGRGDDACRTPSSARCHAQTSLRMAGCMLSATRRAVCWVPRGMSRRMSWQCRYNHKAVPLQPQGSAATTTRQCRYSHKAVPLQPQGSAATTTRQRPEGRLMSKRGSMPRCRHRSSVTAAPGRCRIQGQNVRLGAMERAACNVLCNVQICTTGGATYSVQRATCDATYDAQHASCSEQRTA